jgi:hypothetical protein
VFYGDNRTGGHGQCLTAVDSENVRMRDCTLIPRQSWRVISGNRLQNIDYQTCLGMGGRRQYQADPANPTVFDLVSCGYQEPNLLSVNFLPTGQLALRQAQGGVLRAGASGAPLCMDVVQGDRPYLYECRVPPEQGSRDPTWVRHTYNESEALLYQPELDHRTKAIADISRWINTPTVDEPSRMELFAFLNRRFQHALYVKEDQLRRYAADRAYEPLTWFHHRSTPRHRRNGYLGTIYNERAFNTVPLFRFKRLFSIDTRRNAEREIFHYAYAANPAAFLAPDAYRTGRDAYRFDGVEGFIYPTEVPGTVPFYGLYNQRDGKFELFSDAYQSFGDWETTKLGAIPYK